MGPFRLGSRWGIAAGTCLLMAGSGIPADAPGSRSPAGIPPADAFARAIAVPAAWGTTAIDGAARARAIRFSAEPRRLSRRQWLRAVLIAHLSAPSGSPPGGIVVPDELAARVKPQMLEHGALATVEADGNGALEVWLRQPEDAVEADGARVSVGARYLIARAALVRGVQTVTIPAQNMFNWDKPVELVFVFRSAKREPLAIRLHAIRAWRPARVPPPPTFRRSSSA